MTQKGTCRFCGQQNMIVVGAELTEEEINEQATLECKCEEARGYQRRHDSKAAAVAWIEAHEIGKTELFKAAISDVVDGNVDKVTIKTGEYTYTVNLDTDNNLNLKERQAISQSEKF